MFDLQKLKAERFPHFDWAGPVQDPNNELTDVDKKNLDQYFSSFAALSGHCPGCKGEFSGSLLATIGIGVGIEWGLMHGEGSCSKCGYPYRANHKIKDLFTI